MFKVFSPTPLEGVPIALSNALLSLLFTISPNGQELILKDGFNKEELGITKTSVNLNLNEKGLDFRLSMFNEANSKNYLHESVQIPSLAQ